MALVFLEKLRFVEKSKWETDDKLKRESVSQERSDLTRQIHPQAADGNKTRRHAFLQRNEKKRNDSWERVWERIAWPRSDGYGR